MIFFCVMMEFEFKEFFDVIDDFFCLFIDVLFYFLIKLMLFYLMGFIFEVLIYVLIFEQCDFFFLIFYFLWDFLFYGGDNLVISNGFFEVVVVEFCGIVKNLFFFYGGSFVKQVMVGMMIIFFCDCFVDGSGVFFVFFELFL